MSAAKTSEARILQRHFGELVALIQDPPLLTAELYSRAIVSSELLERTSNPTLARGIKNIAILSTVISYLEVHPEKFSEVIEVLKGDPTLAPLAARIETYEKTLTVTNDYRDIVNALADLNDWYSLGIQLGLPKPQLEKIEYDHYRVSRCKQEVISFWLRWDTEATWSKLADAVEIMGKRDIATAIRQRRLNESIKTSQDQPTTQLPPAIGRYANYLKLQYKLPAIEKWPPSPLKKSLDQILFEKTDAQPNEETDELHEAREGSATKTMKKKKTSEILKTDDGSTPKCAVVEGGPKSTKAKGKLFTEGDLVVMLKTREKQVREAKLKKTLDENLFEKTEAKPNEEIDELHEAREGSATKITKKKKKAIGLSEILKTDDGSTPKCVLVEGGPGTGKSTLAWGACQGWAKGKLFTEYDLVVMLKMREKRVREAKEVSDLFAHKDPDLQREVAKEVIEREGRGVLFIFEALDELSQLSLLKESVFMNILTGCVLPASTILVTSRPWATKPLLEKCESMISRHLELIGFTEDNVTRYIAEAFPDKQGHAEFQMYLGKQLYVQTVMNIPLNCAIVVQLYKSYKGTPHVPRTMTQLYSSLVLSLLQRYVKDHPLQEGIVIQDLAHLPSPICEQFHSVCKLAFTGSTNPSAEVIFTDDELPANFNSLGLMQTTTQIHPDVGTRISYHFLHITLQEFLAAFHLSLWEEPKQVDFLQQNAFSVKCAVMLAFLFGLTSSSLTLWKSLLLAFQLDSSDRLDLSENVHCLHWLYESQNVDACAAFLGADRIVFSPIGNLVQLDLYALGYCIFHSNSSWEIDLSYSISNPEAALMLSKAFTDSSNCTTDDSTSFTGSISILCDTSFGDSAFLSLLKAPPRILQGLKKLDLEYSSEITSVSCNALANSLNKKMFPSLTFLSLEHSSIGEGGAIGLISALMMSSTIQELNLASTGIGPRDIEELGKLLMKSRSLKNLRIKSNPLDSSSLQLIACLLPNYKSLQHLCLCGISFTTEDVAFLAWGLQENHSLEALCLTHCNIDSTGATHLAEALQNNRTLKKLYMSLNSIGEKGARAFAEILETNRTLKLLHLVDQSIQINGAIKLITALESNTTLVRLILHSSCEPFELEFASTTAILERCRFM